MKNDSTIHVVIKNQDGIILDSNFTALSSYNEVGLFDVLPMHTNFISLIRNKIFLHNNREVKEMPIGMGILKVVDNQATVYLGFTEIELEKDKKKKPFTEGYIHDPNSSKIS